MNGLLIIDKPAGMSSRDAVNVVQKWFPRKTKIGHTGTLDPLATGVLVVCVGAATRLADFVQAMGKSYQSRFRLGATSTTDDADGIITPCSLGENNAPDSVAVSASLRYFLGTIEQFPPAYSALKLAGHRAHDLARQGKEVPLAARAVRIDDIRILNYDWPYLDVEVDCGKGTYIRSIARDLGARLGVGGLVETLRRTRIGPFTVEQATGIDSPPANLSSRLLPMVAALAGMPRFQIDSESERRFRTGQAVPIPEESETPTPAEGTEVAVFD
ncbi:MAG TPA: tRNA pseudouridine(55) synthase TruB, partial [Urbifossiella sp.]